MKDVSLTQAYQTSEAAQYVMSLQDVGIVGMALLVLVYVGGMLLKHYFLNGKRSDAEIGFLDHLGDRLKKMEELVEKLSAENRGLILENANLSARIALLEQHEAEVSKLKKILDQKDDKISDLEIAVENLLQDKEQLALRVKALEQQKAECNCTLMKE